MERPTDHKYHWYITKGRDTVTGGSMRGGVERDFREREHVTPILILAVIVFFCLRTAIYRTFRNILMAEFEGYSKY